MSPTKAVNTYQEPSRCLKRDELEKVGEPTLGHGVEKDARRDELVNKMRQVPFVQGQEVRDGQKGHEDERDLISQLENASEKDEQVADGAEDGQAQIEHSDYLERELRYHFAAFWVVFLSEIEALNFSSRRFIVIF